MIKSRVTTSIRRNLCLRRSEVVETKPSILYHIHWSGYYYDSTNIRSSGRRVNMFSTTTDATPTITPSTAATDHIDDTNNNNNNRSKILSLYRSIRRIHERSLPTNLRDMGNKYLQSEFRTLKDTTKMTTKHFENFMIEWEKYRQQLLQSQKETKFGQPLPTDVQLTTEQQQQLRKLHQEMTSANVNQNTETDNKLG